MSVPTHGLDCRTWTFPAKCKSCGDEIFHFSCSCGSKAVFDELGWPWPEHCCKFSRSDWKWARSRPRKKFGDGGVQVEISDQITATRPPDSPSRAWNIDPSVVDEAKRNVHSRQRNPIEAVPPGGNWAVEIIGVVRELERQLDVYRFLKLPRTEINKAFLGVLGIGEWGRVTIHVLENVIYSYTVWVPSELLADDISKGVAVSVELRRLDIANKAREWVCEGLKTD